MNNYELNLFRINHILNVACESANIKNFNPLLDLQFTGKDTRINIYCNLKSEKFDYHKILTEEEIRTAGLECCVYDFIFLVSAKLEEYNK